MFKRTQQLALVLLVLVFAYFATFTAGIRWLQIAPNQVVWVIHKLTDVQVGFQDLKLKQTWLGVEVEVEDFRLVTPDIQLNSQKIAFDYNVWSPFFYGMSLGESLFLEGLSLEINQPTQSEENLKDNSSSQLPSFHIRQLWQKIQLKKSSIVLNSAQPLNVTVLDFQSLKGLHWRTLGEFLVSWDNQPAIELQLKSDFEMSFLGRPLEGDLFLYMSKPLLIDSWLGALPEQWQEALPRGELLGRLQASLTTSQELVFSAELNAQQLTWLENDAVMPKSMGVKFKFKPNLENQPFSLTNWDFELDSLRLDNAYVEAHSPIKLALKEGAQLEFAIPSLSVKPFLPILHRILKPLDIQVQDLADIQFKVTQAHGTLDLKNIALSQFDFNFIELNLPAYGYYPAVSAKELKIVFADDQLKMTSNHPVFFQMDDFRAEPVALHFKQPIEFKKVVDTATWQLVKQSFQLDTLAVEATATIDTAANIDLKLSLTAATLKDAKTFIPYPLMGEALQTWLKESLVAGDNVAGSLVVQGNLKDFPFHSMVEGMSLGHLFVELSIENTQLKFDPDWPAIKGFKANLKFTPYKLTISTDAAQMLEASLANVLVTIDNLDKDDIAVDIQGLAKSTLPNALNLLSQSPLLKAAGIEKFIPQQLKTTGDVHVNLPKIWIPVYGYAGREVEVKGTATLLGNEALLFNKVKLINLKGDVAFTELSVQAKHLTGEFAGGALNGILSTQNNAEFIELQLSGDLQSQQLLSELLGFKSSVTGNVPWNLNLSLPFKSDLGITATSLSSLNKVKSEFPKPFDSELFEKHGQNLKTQMTIAKGVLTLQAQLTNWGRVHLLWDLEKSEPLGFKVNLGGKQGSEALKEVSQQYQIKAVFDEIDVSAWQSVLKSEEKGAASLPSWLGQKDWVSSNLQVNRLQLNDDNIYLQSNLRWQYLTETDELLAEFVSQQGSLYFKKDQLKNYSLRAQDVIYNLVPSESSPVVVEECRPWPTFGINTVTFEGTNLKVNERAIDVLSFDYEDSISQQLIKNISLKSAALGGDVSGEYKMNKETQLSSLAFKLSSTDVAKLSNFLEIKQGFTGKSGWMTADLNWLGSIDCLKLANLNGQAEFKVEDGVIQNAEPGLARLLGLLSIESLARRLKLDIKDVVKAGLAFDSISSKGNFINGELSLKDFKLEAPSADASLFGKVNLVNRKVQFDVRITPSIGTTLPIVVAVSGVATPIAGILAYALMKVIPAINEDLVTYRYEVSGTIENPEIKDKGFAIELLNNEKRETNDLNILDY